MLRTCYVLEDGSIADASEVARDDKDVLRKGRIAVAMRGDVPRTRSVDTETSSKPKVEVKQEPETVNPVAEEPAAEEPKAEEAKTEEAKDVKPEEEPRRGYRTRESKAD